MSFLLIERVLLSHGKTNQGCCSNIVANTADNFNCSITRVNVNEQYLAESVSSRNCCLVRLVLIFSFFLHCLLTAASCSRLRGAKASFSESASIVCYLPVGSTMSAVDCLFILFSNLHGRISLLFQLTVSCPRYLEVELNVAWCSLP
jgi:hypothetical protein